MLAALQAKLGGIDDHVFKAGSCLSGGVVGRGETCGALTGGMLAIGNEVGRERLEDIPQLRKARDIATELYLRFQQEVGHSVCGEIHKLKFGRTYRLYDPEEQKAFHEAGGHGDDGCPMSALPRPGSPRISSCACGGIRKEQWIPGQSRCLGVGRARHVGDRQGTPADPAGKQVQLINHVP